MEGHFNLMDGFFFARRQCFGRFDSRETLKSKYINFRYPYLVWAARTTEDAKNTNMGHAVGTGGDGFGCTMV